MHTSVTLPLPRQMSMCHHMRPEQRLCLPLFTIRQLLVFTTPGKGGDIKHIVGPYYTGGGPLKTLLPSGTAIATNLVSIGCRLATLRTVHPADAACSCK
jgi:hypothetical protein